MLRMLVVPAFVLCLCAVGSATVITQTETFNGTPNLNRTFTFDEFDDLGGTLTLQWIRVTVTLDAVGGQIILDNDGENPASGSFEFGAKSDQ